jgi:hypothetical protein
MARLSTLFAIATSLLAAVTALPAEVDSRAAALGVADIINALGIGLVTKIDAFITVSPSFSLISFTLLKFLARIA